MARTALSRIYCTSTSIEGLYIYLASTDHGAVRVGLSLEEAHDCVRYFRNIFSDREVLEGKEKNIPLMNAVKVAMFGKSDLTVPQLDVSLSPFQWNALNTIFLIPFGETRTYGEIASMMGKPGGARAVGQAMGRNPFPILFPCHRVLAANGIGGFSLGLNLKKFLLGREQNKGKI